MADKKFPSLWIETGDDGKICVVMSGAYGPETHLPFVTPAEDLVAAAEMDYTAYRREIQRLYEEHPLFEPKERNAVFPVVPFVKSILISPYFSRYKPMIYIRDRLCGTPK